MHRVKGPPTAGRLSARLLLLAGCGLLAACAHTPTSNSYRLRDVDRAPEFIACSAYSPPTKGTRTTAVWVEFDVSETGSVLNPQARPSLYARRAGLVTTALVVARSCRYRPARKDGRPVAVQGLSRSFSFSLEQRPGPTTRGQ